MDNVKNVYVEMKLSEFVLKCPQIVTNPQILPMVSFLMSQNQDDRYLVRIKDNKLEFGYGEDAWNISPGNP